MLDAFAELQAALGAEAVETVDADAIAELAGELSFDENALLSATGKADAVHVPTAGETIAETSAGQPLGAGDDVDSPDDNKEDLVCVGPAGLSTVRLTTSDNGTAPIEYRVLQKSTVRAGPEKIR